MGLMGMDDFTEWLARDKRTGPLLRRLEEVDLAWSKKSSVALLSAAPRLKRLFIKEQEDGGNSDSFKTLAPFPFRLESLRIGLEPDELKRSHVFSKSGASLRALHIDFDTLISLSAPLSNLSVLDVATSYPLPEADTEQLAAATIHLPSLGTLHLRDFALLPPTVTPFLRSLPATLSLLHLHRCQFKEQEIPQYPAEQPQKDS